jgi:hypothetical protein
MNVIVICDQIQLAQHKIYSPLVSTVKKLLFFYNIFHQVSFCYRFKVPFLNEVGLVR